MSKTPFLPGFSGESSAAKPGSSLKRPRILVCQLRQIGDVLLATPSLELLARHYPDAELHVFTESKCAPMLEGNPHVHTIWPVDKKRLPTLLHELAYYRRVAAGGFDLVIDFQQLPRCRWVVAFSGAPVRLSFSPPWYLRPLYTHWGPLNSVYAGACKAGMLAPLGIRWQGERPRLYLSEEERADARGLLDSLGLKDTPFVTVDLTHRHEVRRWPAPHFGDLMSMAMKAFPDIRFLLLYGPGEEEDVRGARGWCLRQDRVLIPPDMLGLRQMAACQEQAVMHLGNCSAPRHVAVAVDTPSLTVLGATGQGWTFPSPDHVDVQAKSFFSMPCQPCTSNTCSRNLKCLSHLTPDLVFPRFSAHLRYSLERASRVRA